MRQKLIDIHEEKKHFLKTFNNLQVALNFKDDKTEPQSSGTVWTTTINIYIHIHTQVNDGRPGLDHTTWVNNCCRYLAVWRYSQISDKAWTQQHG